MTLHELLDPTAHHHLAQTERQQYEERLLRAFGIQCQLAAEVGRGKAKLRKLEQELVQQDFAREARRINAQTARGTEAAEADRRRGFRWLVLELALWGALIIWLCWLAWRRM